MAKRQLVLALDVGTTKVSALVGEIRPDAELSVLGISAAPVVGMRRGLVFEAERVATAIRDAVNRANSMASTDLSTAVVAINGDHLQLTPGSAGIALKTGTIREEDLRQVLARASQVTLDNDRQVVRVIRRSVAVDGFRGVIDPVGMVAKDLEVGVFVVSGSTMVLKNLRRVLAMAGISPAGWVPAPLAAAQGVLGEDERQLGSVLLDVGGGTTGVSIYRGGELRHLGVVPIGGDAITADLAVGLGVVTAQAERLKLEHAVVSSRREGTVEIRTVNGQSVKLIAVNELEEIVQARVDEWMQYVEAQLQRVEWAKGPAAGVILTGGGAMLKGLSEYIENRWGWPVRLGSPFGLTGLSDLSKSPGYAVVVGVAKTRAGEGALPSSGGLGRVAEFFRHLFR